jgi:hypothetical protein
MRIHQFLAIISATVLISSSSAQMQRLGFFVTPVAHAPFMAVISEQQNTRLPDGRLEQQKSIHAVARNTAGAIYNEARPLVPAGFAVDPPVTVSHIYDPQTRLNTFVYPHQRTYRQAHAARPPSLEPPGPAGSPDGAPAQPNQFTQEVDLGNKTMEGVTVHGTRFTQKVPSATQGGEEVTITDEYWYSAELRLNMQVTHDDPRSGNATMTVTQLTRSEPDASIFAVPDGYQQMNRTVASQP